MVIWELLKLPDHVSLSPDVEEAAQELSNLDECHQTWLNLSILLDGETTACVPRSAHDGVASLLAR